MRFTPLMLRQMNATDLVDLLVQAQADPSNERHVERVSLQEEVTRRCMKPMLDPDDVADDVTRHLGHIARQRQELKDLLAQLQEARLARGATFVARITARDGQPMAGKAIRLDVTIDPELLSKVNLAAMERELGRVVGRVFQEDFKATSTYSQITPYPLPAPHNEDGVHVAHCSAEGCKYGDKDCPVASAPSPEDRMKLWAHLVSQHAGIWDPGTPLADLVEAHAQEHAGPGTIRNHDPADRGYSLKKLGEVLSESEE